MTLLVTGAAGFIGFHLSKALLQRGYKVVGLDNLNSYYDVGLKLGRLEQLGIPGNQAQAFHKEVESTDYPAFSFVRMNLEDRENLPILFKKHRFQQVCNLAAQAGVRYSLENPEAYVDSNLVGFMNLLECCRNGKVAHLIYASSSSVYGLNKKVPFATSDRVDKPISLYAATKKSNELMAYTYSHLFGIPTTGLRFFTVYGPWGRPDMAYYSFTEKILRNQAIPVYNHGNLSRDFTYIDDIVNGIIRIIEVGFRANKGSLENACIYNIGRGKPVNLMEFIRIIGEQLQIKPILDYMPMQEGDVHTTWADTSDLVVNYDYQPVIDLEEGIEKFISWYRNRKGQFI
ncbi:NAD-dependent epimerase/dehydratase family protein [Maribacter algicola]|uniref:NAD-dependent epimerase/dehydratase family protein n=1 Tax=Maribacter algicola TaxID=2498892 RepID=A0A3R8PXX3_9FLAO|nr:NAD-dependent epimerase/dehydratase family protein [Maribacter algicola]RRQ48834.1 NAD-dependent epimerase/dehydratase family protein [Maribacter algicola]